MPTESSAPSSAPPEMATVPDDLEGSTVEDAEDRLYDLGFWDVDSGDASLDATVTSVSPEGDRVPLDTTITITADEPEPTTTYEEPEPTYTYHAPDTYTPAPAPTVGSQCANANQSPECAAHEDWVQGQQEDSGGG